MCIYLKSQKLTASVSSVFFILMFMLSRLADTAGTIPQDRSAVPRQSLLQVGYGMLSFLATN